MALAIAVQSARERRYPLTAVDRATLYVTSATTARRLSIGYSALAADVYWIRALQYYGNLRLQNDAAAAGAAGPKGPALRTTGDRPAGSDYELLYPLLDLTTTLDPRFNIAYRFGSIFLAERPPGGAGRADLAIRLLEKGLRELPDKWEYMLDIGFVHYWWTRDFRAAADWFDRASRVQGAPPWLRALAATTLVAGGDRRTSRLMWEQIRQTAEVDWLRLQAERRLIQLQALEAMDDLQRLVDRETAETGTRLTDWRPLIRARRLRGIPADPAGIPYQIAPDGRVRLGAGSPLAPLPDEPVGKVLPVS